MSKLSDGVGDGISKIVTTVFNSIQSALNIRYPVAKGAVAAISASVRARRGTSEINEHGGRFARRIHTSPAPD